MINSRTELRPDRGRGGDDDVKNAFMSVSSFNELITILADQNALRACLHAGALGPSSTKRPRPPPRCSASPIRTRLAEESNLVLAFDEFAELHSGYWMALKATLPLWR